MIRKLVHKIFTRNMSDGEVLLRIIHSKPLGWINRYDAWFVETYGEMAGTGRFGIWGPDDSPRYLIPVSMFASWLDDWLRTWALRPWRKMP